jgi:L-alanine-DL-glutamate epimerase-like enolase superfamily enzyme
MRITGYRFTVHREPLANPLRFKGGFFTEKWIAITSLMNDAGIWETGIGGLAVLWSDPGVFFSRSETGGNLTMSLVAEEGARCVVGTDVQTPLEVIPTLADRLYAFAQCVTSRSSLRRTFVLNCLVSLDLALWKLFARSKKTETLDELLDPTYRVLLSERHSQIARVPLVDYGLPTDKVVALADEGYFLFKIKLGAPGNQEDMLAQDKERLSQLHKSLKDNEVLYYLDANGRYEKEETLLRLLDHAYAICMMDRIVILEEPYPEDVDIDVSRIPVRVAADESVHGPEEVEEKAERGYKALAIKPAGKTLSIALETIKEAARLKIPCFIADSACVPILVEWNKNIAARLPALPEIGYSILESNGEEHFAHWDVLASEHPMAGASWIVPRKGFYEIGDPFFQVSGGVFRPYPFYERLLQAESSTAAGHT